MTDRILLDSGVLVAIVNRLDPAHEDALAAWEVIDGEVLTVEGAIVEAAWHLRKIPRGPRAAVETVLDIGARVVAPSERRLRRAVELMERYAGVPMDFVDAELVAVAEEEQVSKILSFDRRGFRTYRIHGKRRFEMFPG